MYENTTFYVTYITYAFLKDSNGSQQPSTVTLLMSHVPYVSQVLTIAGPTAPTLHFNHPKVQENATSYIYRPQGTLEPFQIYEDFNAPMQQHNATIFRWT